MQTLGFQELEYRTAKELWDILSPEKTIGDKPGKYIFRGQTDARWSLTPSAMRNKGLVEQLIGMSPPTIELQVCAEISLLREFVNNCDALSLPIPNDSVGLRRMLDANGDGGFFIHYPHQWPTADVAGLLSVAQHHSVPTRLLDWSRRSYVAAYFAARSTLDAQYNGYQPPEKIAVWALDTEQILPLRLANDKPLLGVHHNVFLVTAPGSATRNLAAQSGLFTVHKSVGDRNSPFVSRSLEDEFTKLPSSPLWKLTLPWTECEKLIRICFQFSFSAASLFPSFDGAGAGAVEAAKLWRKIPKD